MAEKIVEKYGDLGRPLKYPFHTVAVNGTISIPIENFSSVANLRTYVSRRSRELKKKFKVTHKTNVNYIIKRTS
jgi:hypothetical protein